MDENIKALELYRKWDKELEAKVEAIMKNSPNPTMDYRTFAPNTQRRIHAVFEKK